MNYAAQTSHYLEADVMSRPREWLVPLLYEHLLSSLRRARAQMEDGEIEGKAESVNRAVSILMELLDSLDRERGGELADGLASLYGFFAGEILAASRTLDRERLHRVMRMIADLHTSWVEAAEMVAPRGRPGGPDAGGRLA